MWENLKKGKNKERTGGEGLTNIIKKTIKRLFSPYRYMYFIDDHTYLCSDDRQQWWVERNKNNTYFFRSDRYLLTFTRWSIKLQKLYAPEEGMLRSRFYRRRGAGLGIV